MRKTGLYIPESRAYCKHLRPYSVGLATAGCQRLLLEVAKWGISRGEPQVGELLGHGFLCQTMVLGEEVNSYESWSCA